MALRHGADGYSQPCAPELWATSKANVCRRKRLFAVVIHLIANDDWPNMAQCSILRLSPPTPLKRIGFNPPSIGGFFLVKIPVLDRCWRGASLEGRASAPLFVSLLHEARWPKAVCRTRGEMPDLEFGLFEDVEVCPGSNVVNPRLLRPILWAQVARGWGLLRPAQKSSVCLTTATFGAASPAISSAG